MAVQSYLDETAGGMVAAAAFREEESASRALDLLASSGVRWQDISVIAKQRRRAERIAGDRAWTPWRRRGRLALLGMALPGRKLPRNVRRRYKAALGGGQVVIIAAAGGQPADTLAALFEQANGERVEQWWQAPSSLFAPPDLGGPF
jgi:hypothetical protein